MATPVDNRTASEMTEQDMDADDADMDVCHHMVGFDESCEWCELEEFEERRARRAAKLAAKQPQQELPLCPSL